MGREESVGGDRGWNLFPIYGCVLMIAFSHQVTDTSNILSYMFMRISYLLIEFLFKITFIKCISR